jgi:hypothetical protein
MTMSVVRGVTVTRDEVAARIRELFPEPQDRLKFANSIMAKVSERQFKKAAEAATPERTATVKKLVLLPTEKGGEGEDG